MHDSALELIGGTPTVELSRAYSGPGRILAKAEFLNPGGSIKDRAALGAILGARERGELAPGQTVVEMTSGNMGSALAVVCGILGHPLVLTISAGNSPARVRMMEALGAEVVVVPQATGSPGNVTGEDIEQAAEQAAAVAAERRGFYVDQFENLDAIRIHETTTGPEIWDDCGGALDGFVAAVGTGATFIGCSKALKARAEVACAAVEPAGAAILAGGRVLEPRHRIQGTGYGVVPPHWDGKIVDAYLQVSDAEVLEWHRELARREGLYVGYSSAANVCAAARLIESGRAETVATLLCDSGLKYH